MRISDDGSSLVSTPVAFIQGKRLQFNDVSNIFPADKHILIRVVSTFFSPASFAMD